MLFALMLGTGFLLTPLVFHAWFERTLVERRRRTEERVQRARSAAHADPPLP